MHTEIALFKEATNSDRSIITGVDTLQISVFFV